MYGRLTAVLFWWCCSTILKKILCLLFFSWWCKANKQPLFPYSYFFMYLCIYLFSCIAFSGLQSKIIDVSFSSFNYCKGSSIIQFLYYWDGERERDPICHRALTHTVKGNGRSNQVFYRKPNMQMCLQQFSETYFRGRDAKRERKKKNHTGKNQLMRLMNISIVLGNGRCHRLQRIGKGNKWSSLERGVWHGGIKCCN